MITVALTKPEVPDEPSTRISAEDLAHRRGITPGSLHTALLRARRIEERTGTWPSKPGQVPKPDEHSQGRTLTWDTSRPDVQAYLHRGRTSRRPQLPAAVAQYPAISATRIAEMVGCSPKAVYDELYRQGLHPTRVDPRPDALDHLSLTELEAAYDKAGRTYARVAATYGCSRDGVIRAFARRRREQELTDAEASTR